MTTTPVLARFVLAFDGQEMPITAPHIEGDWVKYSDALAAIAAAQAVQPTDAERYQFLRSALTATDGTFSIGIDSPDYAGRWALEGHEADAAIDAAIAASKGSAA